MNSSVSLDLAALRLDLRALDSFPVTEHMGRAVNQAGLTLVGVSNPSLANALHDPGDAKPLTASGLMRGEAPLIGRVEAGSMAWVRFTALSADTTAALIAYHNLMKTGEPLEIEIDRKRWQVIGAAWDAGRLPGLFSYQALIDRNTTAALDDHLTLRFLSGTTFHSMGLNVPLPRPDLVFGSLQNRWRMFTALVLRELPDDLFGAFLNYHTEIDHAVIETSPYKAKHGEIFVGFNGEVSFNLLRLSPYLMKKDARIEREIRNYAEWFMRVIQLLGEFAVFSGVGYKTTIGFGMVG